MKQETYLTRAVYSESAIASTIHTYRGEWFKWASIAVTPYP